MTVIKINAITVPADSGDELARRFAGRAGAIDGAPGFEGFELLQPTDGRDVWLVVTRWTDEESYENWTESSGFAKAHGGRAKDPATGMVARPADDAGEVDRRGSGQATPDAPASIAEAGVRAGDPADVVERPADSTAAPEDRPARRPIGMSAELWSYVVAGGTGA